MSATVIPPPVATERARQRFNEFVALGKQAVEAGKIWARIGRLAVQMEEDRDFATLGYETMNACIMEIELLSGYDRSSIYAYKTLYRDISSNGGESIFEMPLGSARIYQGLPGALQRDKDVQIAARAKPKLFLEKVSSDYPQAIMESKIRLTLSLEMSLYNKWRAFLVDCRARNGEQTTYEQAFEELLANVDTADQRRQDDPDRGAVPESS